MTKFKLFYKPFPKELQGIVNSFISARGQIPLIVIDSTSSEEAQRLALRHELAHLMLNHLDTPEADLDRMEREADSIAEYMTDAEVSNLLQWAI